MNAKSRRTLWTIIALVTAFALGVGARELGVGARDLLPINLDQPTAVVVEPVTVRVNSPDAVTVTRAKLIRYLFGTEYLPTERPIDNGDGTYDVRMTNGLQSRVRLVRPTTTPSGRLVLYHAGHVAYGDVDRMVVDDLVARGDTVLVFEMPLIGANATVIEHQLPNGTVPISRHDHLSFLAADTVGSPVRYLIEPVIVMLNEFGPMFDDISMIGLSGGGWTTTLAAAIDTRIDRSYQAAGTLPMAVRFARDDSWGDYEQNLPSLYAIADYPDLYVLGASGRRQIQILNEHDPCCFGGDYRALYEPQVVSALETAGGGSFSVYLDSDNRQHSISRAALSVIEADMDGHPPPDR